MRRLLLTCGCMLLVGFGAASEATALPASQISAARFVEPDGPIEQVQSRIGYWRKRYDRAQYRRYRGNPGAQYELRQKRRNLCRNVPEMC